MQSRPQRPLTRHFPEIVEAVARPVRRRHSALGWLTPLEFENQSKIVSV